MEHAARIMKQSAGAFLEKAGEDRARQILLDWALDRYAKGEASFSELAAETGLSLEEIMTALGEQGRAEEALDVFLSSCRAVAEATANEDFLRSAEQAVKITRRARAAEQP